MAVSVFLRPIALADSPQSEEGEALLLAGGLVYASRFALITRAGAGIAGLQRLDVLARRGWREACAD